MGQRHVQVLINYTIFMFSNRFQSTVFWCVCVVCRSTRALQMFACGCLHMKRFSTVMIGRHLCLSGIAFYWMRFYDASIIFIHACVRSLVRSVHQCVYMCVQYTCVPTQIAAHHANWSRDTRVEKDGQVEPAKRNFFFKYCVYINRREYKMLKYFLTLGVTVAVE